MISNEKKTRKVSDYHSTPARGGGWNGTVTVRKETYWEPKMEQDFAKWCSSHSLSSIQKSYLRKVLYQLDAIGFWCNFADSFC